MRRPRLGLVAIVFPVVVVMTIALTQADAFNGSEAGASTVPANAGSASGSYRFGAGSGVARAANAAVSPLVRSLDAYMATREGVGAIAVYDPKSGLTYTAGPSNETFSSASVIKLTIMIGVLVKAQDEDRALTSGESADLHKMISVSDNDAATSLWNELGVDSVRSLLEEMGATSTVPGLHGEWGLTKTTASDQLKVMRTITEPNAVLDDPGRSQGIALLRSVIPSQHWGVSAGASAPRTVLLKNGWLPEGTTWDINSVGYMAASGHRYDIAVLTASNPTQQYGIATTEGAATVVYKWMGRQS